MMKVKNVQSIICLVIFSLFANQAWATDWIYFDTTSVGDMYYDKSSIKKTDKSIISVWNKDILSEEAKTKYFSILKGIHKAPDNPSMLSYYTKLMEIDCVNKKIKDISVIFYDEKGNVIYSSPKSESGKWNAIIPNTVGEKLINIVSCEPVTPNEVVVVPKIEKPVVPTKTVVAAKVEEPAAPKEAAATAKAEEPAAPKEAAATAKAEEPVAPKEVIAATAAPIPAATSVAVPAVTENLTPVSSKQNETKSIPEEDVRNLVNKWLASWQSGDIDSYRSCYASDFQSEGMNLNAWIAYKTNVRQISKKISIRIEDLKISAVANIATAVFTQHYRSALLKHSGKKKLELRKINDEWKIYREFMQP
ncbi:MAG: surface-adhesin E family protein [Smithella sp.]|jgi:ketosteroid isomerase-like protein